MKSGLCSKSLIGGGRGGKWLTLFCFQEDKMPDLRGQRRRLPVAGEDEFWGVEKKECQEMKSNKACES